jgi:catechol 2,3-dioxygenase-like lactoylglutathione lyase family enzyme
MSLVWLDHVSIRTVKLDKMTQFYVDILGMEIGARPSFPFNGCWLYCGGRAAVHLVESSSTPAASEPQIEHFAFRARDLLIFLDKLKRHGIRYRMATVPELELTQIHIMDPDGNHIEVAFDTRPTGS